MATIADYQVISDGSATLTRGTGSGVNYFRQNFSIPGNINQSVPSVLLFRIEVEEASGLKYTIYLNDKEVLTLTHSTNRFGTIHEIIPGDTIRYGDNQFRIVATEGTGVMKISDVFVQFQVTV